MNRATRVLCCAVFSLAACDPVVDDAVTALGGEPSGEHPGPMHRPGQPCLLCHDGALGDPPEFSLAGTVFQHPTGVEAAQGATVELRNADGSGFEVVTNRAGNFYLTPDHFRPHYPLEVKVHWQGEITTMHTTIGREGSCAGCHSDPAGRDSPGHVYLRLDDGGVPP
jgi:hypothetical protein